MTPAKATRLLPQAALVGIATLCTTLALVPTTVWLQLAAPLLHSPTARTLLSQALGPERAASWRWLWLGAALCWLGLAGLLRLWRPMGSPRYALTAWWRRTRSLWHALSRAERGTWLAFGLLVALWRAWCAWHTPITYDEAYSYLNFSAQGPLVALLYYPGTNNHPLFNALNALVPGVRLLPWASGLVLLVLAWRWALPRLGGWRTALLLVLLASAYPMQLYGIHARGYGWLLMVALLAAMSWQAVAQRGWHSRYAGLWVGSLALASWALPSTVYLAVGYWLAWVLFVRRGYSGWLLSGLAYVALVLGFYLPLAACNGPQSLLQTGTLQDMATAFSLHSYGQMVADTLRWCWQMGPWGALSVVPMALLAWRALRHKVAFAGLLLVQCLLWLVVVPLTGVLQFPRTFAYLVPLACLGLVWVLPKAGRLVQAALGLGFVYAAAQVLLFVPTLAVEYREAFAAQAFMADAKTARACTSVFASDAYFHQLRLAGFAPLLQPQTNWAAVRHTTASCILAHPTGDSLHWIPAPYVLADSLPGMRVYRRP